MPIDIYNYSRGYDSIPTILIVCAAIGLVLGIILLAVFLPASKRGRYFGAAKWFYDFLNFHSFWITSLLKIINIAVFTVGILGGLICLFIDPSVTLLLFAGVIVYRITLELIMVMLSIQSNVSSIDNKLSRLYGQSSGTFSGEPSYGMPPVQNTACPSCGNEYAPGTKFCMKCGRQLF